MRNKWLVAGVVALASGFAHAGQAEKSLFNCVDLNQYAVDSQCSASIISQGKEFKAAEQQLSLKLEQANPNAIATVQFNPKNMTIRVIAQRDREESADKLFALR